MNLCRGLISATHQDPSGARTELWRVWAPQWLCCQSWWSRPWAEAERPWWEEEACVSTAGSAHHQRSPKRSCNRWLEGHRSVGQTAKQQQKDTLRRQRKRCEIKHLFSSRSTSSCGKPKHWSPTKQLRKGTGMKQKRTIRNTVPLMTPWDSGLQTEDGNYDPQNIRKITADGYIIEKDSHFLFDGFVEVHSVQPGRDEMLLESWDEFQSGHAAENWQEAVDEQRQDGDRWRVFSHFARADSDRSIVSVVDNLTMSLHSFYQEAPACFTDLETFHTIVFQRQWFSVILPSQQNTSTNAGDNPRHLSLLITDDLSCLMSKLHVRWHPNNQFRNNARNNFPVFLQNKSLI